MEEQQEEEEPTVPIPIEGVPSGGGDDDDGRPLEDQLASAHARIQALNVELATARAESRAHKHEADILRRRLKVSRGG